MTHLAAFSVPADQWIDDHEYLDALATDHRADDLLIRHAQNGLLTALSLTGCARHRDHDLQELLVRIDYEARRRDTTQHRSPWPYTFTPDPPYQYRPAPEQFVVFFPKDAEDADRYVRELNEANWERLRLAALDTTAECDSTEPA